MPFTRSNNKKRLCVYLNPKKKDAYLRQESPCVTSVLVRRKTLQSASIRNTDRRINSFATGRLKTTDDAAVELMGCCTKQSSPLGVLGHLALAMTMDAAPWTAFNWHEMLIIIAVETAAWNAVHRGIIRVLQEVHVSYVFQKQLNTQLRDIDIGMHHKQSNPGWKKKRQKI
jgi:hypothetical protein